MTLSGIVFYNTLVQVFGKILTLVFGIATTALLTDYLGPEGFGNYIFVLSIVAIFSSISDWGTSLIGVREVSKEEKNKGGVFINILFLRLILSFLAILFIFLLAKIFPLEEKNLGSLRKTIIASSFLVLTLNLKNSFFIVFQAKLKMERAVLVDFSASFLTLIFSLFAIRTGGDLFILVLAVFLANLIAIIIGFLLVSRLIFVPLSFSWPIFKKIFFESLPLGGTLVVYSLYNRLDTLLLQGIKGSEAVGIYGVSYRIYEVLILGAAFLMNTLLPIFSQGKTRGKLAFYYQKTLDILILAGIVVFLGTLIFSPLMLMIITRQRFVEFAQSVLVLRILGLAVFVSYLNHLTGYTIVSQGLQQCYFLIALLALGFNFIGNLILIPTFSYYGAALITFLTESLVFVLTSLYLAKKIGLYPGFFSFPKTALEIIFKKGRFLD